MTIRAIETRYKVYRFRSRLEAMWAVFFEQLGIEWEYEPEGYFVDGRPYLPDFVLRLPDVGLDSDESESLRGLVFVEVKPTGVDEYEGEHVGICRKLAVGAASPVVVLVGVPAYRMYHVFTPDLEATHWQLAFFTDGREALQRVTGSYWMQFLPESAATEASKEVHMKRVLLLALLAVAACSGQSGNGPAPATEAAQPQATTTTAPQHMTAKQLVAKLQQAGLPVGKVDCFTEETDPNDLLGRPGGYTSKCDWADKREEQLTQDDLTGGSFEVFGSAADAAERAKYLGAFEGAGAFSTGYTWVVPAGGVTILRIDQELTPTAAAKYRSAAEQAVK
jgi:hypothetical protein